jgi:hypothetical protein
MFVVGVINQTGRRTALAPMRTTRTVLAIFSTISAERC